jgi:hypothetical protein
VRVLVSGFSWVRVRILWVRQYFTRLFPTTCTCNVPSIFHFHLQELLRAHWHRRTKLPDEILGYLVTWTPGSGQATGILHSFRCGTARRTSIWIRLPVHSAFCTTSLCEGEPRHSFAFLIIEDQSLLQDMTQLLGSKSIDDRTSGLWTRARLVASLQERMHQARPCTSFLL